MSVFYDLLCSEPRESEIPPTTLLADTELGHLGPHTHYEFNTGRDWPEKIVQSVGIWQSAYKSWVLLVQEKKQLAYLALRKQFSRFTKTSHSWIVLINMLNSLE